MFTFAVFPTVWWMNQEHEMHKPRQFLYTNHVGVSVFPECLIVTNVVVFFNFILDAS